MTAQSYSTKVLAIEHEAIRVPTEARPRMAGNRNLKKREHGEHACSVARVSVK